MSHNVAPKLRATRVMTRKSEFGAAAQYPPCIHKGPSRKRRLMLDLIFLGSTIFFFLLALAYVRGCEKL